MTKLKILLVAICSLVAALWPEAQCMDSPIPQNITFKQGNYVIAHNHTENDANLLSWEWPPEKLKSSPCVQLLKSGNENYEFCNATKAYAKGGNWRNAVIWSVQKAEDNYYTIKNVALDGGMLSWSPGDTNAKLLNGNDYMLEENLYTPGGNLRSNVLWKIDMYDNKSWVIRSHHDNKFLSELRINSKSGSYVGVLDNNDSYLQNTHPIVKSRAIITP